MIGLAGGRSFTTRTSDRKGTTDDARDESKPDAMGSRSRVDKRFYTIKSRVRFLVDDVQKQRPGRFGGKGFRGGGCDKKREQVATLPRIVTRLKGKPERAEEAGKVLCLDELFGRGWDK